MAAPNLTITRSSCHPRPPATPAEQRLARAARMIRTSWALMGVATDGRDEPADLPAGGAGADEPWARGMAALCATPADTLAGVVTKARVVRDDVEDGILSAWGEELLASLLGDLERLADGA
jgi:hypothetical protein